jgi:hypothetical protein
VIYNTDGYRYPGWDYTLMREPVRGGPVGYYYLLLLWALGKRSSSQDVKTSKLTGEIL